jgi:hypothetical protein
MGSIVAEFREQVSKFQGFKVSRLKGKVKIPALAKSGLERGTL